LPQWTSPTKCSSPVSRSRPATANFARLALGENHEAVLRLNPDIASIVAVAAHVFGFLLENSPEGPG